MSTIFSETTDTEAEQSSEQLFASRHEQLFAVKVEHLFLSVVHSERLFELATTRLRQQARRTAATEGPL